MSVGAILGKCFRNTFSILKKNIVTILLFVLIVSLPLWAIDFFCVSTIIDYDEISGHVSEYQEMLKESENQDSDTELSAELKADFQKMMIYYLLELVLGLLALLQTCAVVIFTKKKTDDINARVNTMEVLEDAAAVFPRALLAELIVAVSVAFGAMLFVFPGVFIYAINAFTLVATILRKSRRTGRTESLTVFKNNIGASILTILISVGIPFGISYFMSILVSLLSQWYVPYAIASGLVFIIDGIITSAGVMFTTAFYLDRTEMEFETEKVSN